MNESELARLISEAAMQIHESVGGKGLVMEVYRDALKYELEKRGIKVEKRVIEPGTYQGVKTKQPTLIDVVVDDKVIVDCRVDYKAVYEAQALAQLRVSGLKLALVINFNEETLRNAIRRVTNYE
jgi:GxxExxY protein